jgi:4-amino-4-deoxy-L-arabinose transferase-like glycosyltransferase
VGYRFQLTAPISGAHSRNLQSEIFMTTRTRTDILLLAGFCAFLFFYGLGAFGLIGADEPRYAQVAREMLDRGDWITPTLGGHAWLEKPPLYYWQAMIAYSIFGVTDVAARIPAAVDATLLVIAVYLFFREFRRGGEIDAALITASCAGVIGYARAASMDMALAAAFGIGMLAWWAWRETGRRIFLAAFYVLAALGMLAKGPVAPFLAGLIIVLFAAVAREWRALLKSLWPPGILLFCLIALPWYLAVQMRNPQFFREFILEHNLARFSTNLYRHPQPFWYYVPVTVLALMPWIAFVIAAITESLRAWWGERKSAETDIELKFRMFACCWLIVPLLFFSISQSKLPGYILPAVPAGAVLLADYLLKHLEQSQPVSKLLIFVHAVIAPATIVPAVLVGFLVMEHHLPAGRPLLFAVAIAVVVCLAIALTLVNPSRLRMLRFVTLVPVVLTVAAVLKLGTTAIDRKLSTRPLAIELANVETHKLPIAVCGAPREAEFGLAFYRNQVVARYESGDVPAGEHLLVASLAWKDNVAKATAGRRVLFLGHYAAQDLDYFWVAGAK